jgi:hypothetical protein
MKISTVRNGFAMMAAMLLSNSWAQEKAKDISANMELGGRGLLYSLNGDYQIDPQFRVGLSYAGINKADFIFVEFRDFRTLGAYMDFTFHRSETGRGSWFTGVGLTHLKADIGAGGIFTAIAEGFGATPGSDETVPISGLMVPIALGWEWRGYSGFLFRTTFYATYMRITSDGETASKLAPYWGMTLGWAF